VDKYLYEYKVCGLRLHTLRRLVFILVETYIFQIIYHIVLCHLHAIILTLAGNAQAMEIKGNADKESAQEDVQEEIPKEDTIREAYQRMR